MAERFASLKSKTVASATLLWQRSLPILLPYWNRLAAWTEKIFGPDEPPVSSFSPALLKLQHNPPHPTGRRVLMTLLFLLAGLFIWAAVGQLDIVAITEGKLVPQTYVKIVQPSEAGIVREILVNEGQHVQAGQVLMRMDTLPTEADTKSVEADYQRKRLQIRRIEAELSNLPFRIEPGDPPELAREVDAQYQANRAARDAALAEERTRLIKAQEDLQAAIQVQEKLTAVLPHYQKQEQAFDKLVKEGFAGSIMGSDKHRERLEKEQELKTQTHVIASARASIAQSEKKLIQIDSDYRRQLHAELNDTQSAYDKLSQELAKQTHKRDLLELRAPQDAIVKDLATHTIGTVVQPATVLVSLVPENETLRAEVWVSNDDIGFIHPGQKVKLKFAAYPFQKYGMAEGTIAHVSADAADASGNTGNSGPATDRNGRPAPLVYKALVDLQQTALRTENEVFPLTAGMQTNAEILLGTRSVLEYLLSPVQKAWHEAARER